MRRVWMTVLGACAGAGQDIETPTTTPTEAPDVAGAYSAKWSPIGDCDVIPGAPSDVVTGPLDLIGSGGLLFDFGEAAFPGTIDETFSFELEGTATVDGWTVTLDGSGLAYIAGDLWVLDGELEMHATDSDAATCTAAGRMTASQLE